MSPTDLLQAHLDRLEAWHTAQRQREDAVAVRGPLRDQRLATQRRENAMARQVEALRHRTDEALRSSARTLTRTGPTLVVAQRQEWSRTALCAALRTMRPDAEVVPAADGADVVGIALADQPELLVVDHTMPLMNAVEILPAVRELSPRTLVVVGTSGPEEREEALRDGADHAYVRSRPMEVASLVLDLLTGTPPG